MTRPPDEDMHQAIMLDDDAAVGDLVAGAPDAAQAHDEVSPILTALYRARHDPLQALLAARPALSADEAAALGDVEALRAHLDRDPDAARRYAVDGETLLHRAARFGRAEACTLLLDHGADPDAYAHNAEEIAPIHAAIGGRQYQIVPLLLDRGANVDAQEVHGFTPLHQAAALDDRNLADLLLARGANASVEADEGRTPADIAYLAENDDLARHLRAHES